MSQKKLIVYYSDRTNGSCTITSPRLGISVDGKSTEAARRAMVKALTQLENDAADAIHKIHTDQEKDSF